MYIMRILGQAASYKKTDWSIVDPVLDTGGETRAKMLDNRPNYSEYNWLLWIKIPLR